MSVKWREDRKKWLVHRTVAGKRMRILCATKKEAMELDQRLKLLRLECIGIPQRYSIADAFASYLATESQQKTDASKKADKYFFDLGLRFFSDERKLLYVDEITLEDLQLFQIFSQKAYAWSDTTVSNKMKLLKALFKKLMVTERLVKNPAEHWKVPAGTGERRRAMTRAEFTTLYETAPDWYRPILAFIRLTGARGASVARLRWSDVDFSMARLLLESRKGGLKKTKKIPFPLYDALYQLLARQKNLDPLAAGEDFVFKNESGGPLTGPVISATAHKLIKKAGLKGVVLYGLRHAIAVDLTEAGVSIEITRQLMGHSTITQTQNYAQGIHSDALSTSIKLIRDAEASTPEDTVSESIARILPLKSSK